MDVRITTLLMLAFAGAPLLADEQAPFRGHLFYQNNLASPGDVAAWRMEGSGVTEFRDGWMEMSSPGQDSHHVFWCPVEFPDRFMAEWEARNLAPEAGLCILFFAARGMNGEDIFDPSLPARDGAFKWYIKDRLGSYHISYYANTPDRPDRGKAHLRKNNEFRLVQEGGEGIPAGSTAVHQMRLIKDGPHIRLFIDGRKVIDWTDTDENDSRPYYREGKIGFRQMQWTHFRYRNFRVWELEDVADRLADMADLPVIHPKQRIWPEPSMDRVAEKNPPSLLWPRQSGKGMAYDVRLSRDPSFPADATISAEGIPWTIYNPHRELEPGTWHWQYRTAGKAWSARQSFLITEDSHRWDPPPAETLLARIPSYRPRVLVDQPEQAVFREKSAGTREAERYIAQAESHIGKPAPLEDADIVEIEGDDPQKTDKLQKDASKDIGSTLFMGVMPLCKAYLLTGDDRFAATAIEWALEGASWDPAGVTRINDFGDSRIMLSMAVVYDTFFDRLKPAQRAALLGAVQARASHFYHSYINNKEGVVVSNHVWQHIFHYLFDTALAVHGDLPEADQWLAYLYEMFLARAPILGGEDGGWVHGLSYFRMNFEVLIDVPQRLKRYTGFDFLEHTPWYSENTNYFLYGFPPGSAGTGFSDNSHDLPEPRGDYMAYADALSRLVRDPYAAWYRDRIAEVTQDLKPHVQAYMRPTRVSDDPVDIRLEDTDMLQWYRLKYLYDIPSVEPASPAALPRARVFRGVGLVTMHSQDLSQYAGNNLFLAMRASPFGTDSHMLSDNNTFNLVYGGDRLFYHTGFKVAMNAPHRQLYYKHTKSHNGILIDGEGQPYSTEAYAWIENFVTGDHLSYAVGNASNAYDSEAEGMDAGLEIFKRHVLMLGARTVVIYDELEAARPVEWSFLLHSYREMAIDPQSRLLAASNRSGYARVYLDASEGLSWSVTNEYEVPAENWRGIREADGSLREYSNDAWHFAAKSPKADRMRFLAILQVRPKRDGAEPEYHELQFLGSDTVQVGKWTITAPLDPAAPARLEVVNTIDGVAFSSAGGPVRLQGRTIEGVSPLNALLVEQQDGHLSVKEAWPEIPAAAAQAIDYFKRQAPSGK